MSTQLCKQCNKPAILDNMCIRHAKQTCAICMEITKSSNTAYTRRLPCGHAFHTKCIMGWFVYSGDCPVCRNVPVGDDLYNFKCNIEHELRQKYKDAIDSLEREITFLRSQRGPRRVRFADNTF